MVQCTGSDPFSKNLLKPNFHRKRRFILKRLFAWKNERNTIMAVFRVQKNKNYTVMSNHHLNDQRISLKAKGLLSYMLSLPDDWDYSLRGLAYKSKENIDAIRTGVLELEQHGYITRYQTRANSGKMSHTVYNIFEKPQPSPCMENPITDEKPCSMEPCVENPTTSNPPSDAPTQLSTKRKNTHAANPHQSNPNQSLTVENGSEK